MPDPDALDAPVSDAPDADDGGSAGPVARERPGGVDHAGLATALYEARRDRVAIEPLSATHELDIADAYAIQRSLVGRLLDDGGDVIGWKLGLTSAPMQELLGVDEPDYGPVLSSMAHDSGVELALDRFIQPKVEAEIALVLGAELRGPDVSVLEAHRAVAGAVAAIEVVDSRIADWRISLVDTVADLASSGATVRGTRIVPLVGFDPRLVGMVIRRNGAMVATGAGAAALGDPIAAVAWLARTLAGFGERLEAGHLVMTGSLHAAFDVGPGDHVEATFDRLGRVTCSFA